MANGDVSLTSRKVCKSLFQTFNTFVSPTSFLPPMSSTFFNDREQYDYPDSDFYETSDAKEILQSLASTTQLQPLSLDSSDCLPPFEVIVNPSHLQSVVGGTKNYNDYIDGKFHEKCLESNDRNLLSKYQNWRQISNPGTGSINHQTSGHPKMSGTGSSLGQVTAQ